MELERQKKELQERLERERIEKDKAEQVRQMQESLEKEKERVEKEKAEQLKKEQEKLSSSTTNAANNKFQDGLRSLEEMGFIEKQKNVQLMIKHNGDVMAVVQELLN